MFSGSKEIDGATEALNSAYQNLLRSLVVATSARIIEVTEDFAPDTTDFNEAIYVGGPDGDHSLIVVEDEIADYLRSQPHIVDAMKMSDEFENEHDDELYKAARAIVNESLRLTEIDWEEKYPSDKSARYR